MKTLFNQAEAEALYREAQADSDRIETIIDWDALSANEALTGCASEDGGVQ